MAAGHGREGRCKRPSARRSLVWRWTFAHISTRSARSRPAPTDARTACGWAARGYTSGFAWSVVTSAAATAPRTSTRRPISTSPGIRSSGPSSPARIGVGATPTRLSSTPPAGRCAAASLPPCARRPRSHPRGRQPFDSGQLRVGTVGEIHLDKLARTCFLDARESASHQQLVELDWTEQAEERLAALLSLGHCPAQAGGGHLAQLGGGNNVGRHQPRARDKRGDQPKYSLDRRLGQVLRERDRGNNRGRERIETRSIKPGTQVVFLRIEWDESDRGGNSNAHLLEAAALPALGFHSVDLKDLQTAAEVRAPVGERVEACAEDHVLADAILDRGFDHVLDEPGADREGEAERLARWFGKLAGELRHQRCAGLSGQPEGKMIRHQGSFALGVNGATDSGQRRRVAGPLFDFRHL